MSFFEGSSCVCCQKTLTASDDIVACPICGAPHHRSCYKENGGCGCADKHSGGYAWQREPSAEHEDVPETVRCRNCGTENPAGRLNCSDCGKSLIENESDFARDREREQRYGRPDDFVPDSEQIEGVPAGELKRFLGNSSMLYTPIFSRLSKLRKKASFNLLALIFPGFWFVSRKMYALGCTILAGQIFIATFELRFAEYLNGIVNAAYSFNTNDMISAMKESPAVTCMFVGFSMLQYAVIILSGVFGNRIYMNWSLKRIKQLKAASASTEEYNSSLEANGRSNLAITVVILLVYFIVYMYLYSKL